MNTLNLPVTLDDSILDHDVPCTVGIVETKQQCGAPSIARVLIGCGRCKPRWHFACAGCLYELSHGFGECAQCHGPIWKIR